MIQYEDQGQPSVINYNIPEPTTYTGRNLIKLLYPSTIFHNHIGETSTSNNEPSTTLPEPQTPFDRLSSKASIKPSLGVVGSNINLGKSLIKTSTVNGSIVERYGTSPNNVEPGLYIVETYKLSNFLGDYGAGKVVHTFSLLPGERTKISIKSYKNSTTTTKSSSSIFDSYTEETEDTFESSVQSENTSRVLMEDTFNYHAEAEAQASWGVFSAKVSGGVSGGSNSSRENFAKNMASATEKHAQKASSQRDITVNTSSETTVNEGEEEAIERVIENINTDRVLNLVARVMNQMFVSALHLVDIKIGYYNGYRETTKEVPLSEIDDLLAYAIQEPPKIPIIRKQIIDSLKEIIDYRGITNDDFILQHPDFGYWYINRNKKSIVGGINKSVNGILLMQTENILRTDGVIIEALLGQANAHSPFTMEEKEQNIKLKEVSHQSLALKNELMTLFIDSLKTGNDTISNKILDYYEKTNTANNTEL